MPGPPVDWTTFNYDDENSRNNRSETKLSASTVAGLTMRWSKPLPAGNRGLTSTPIVVGDEIYVCEHPGALASYNAKTGAERWRKPGLGAIRCGTPLFAGGRIYVSAGNAMYAFNRDGSMAWGPKSYNVRLSLTDGSPALAGDKIVVGVGTYEVINRPPYSARGIIIAFNVSDGSEAWRFVPAATGMMTTGISVWSSPAVDTKRGLIFIGTGQAYQMPAGEYSDALLAIEYATGKLRWSNQFHQGDTYTDGNAGSPGMRLDYDIGAAPNLFVVNGVDAVGVGSKGALFRVVDRETGKMIWERNLGAPSALGGVMSVAAVADGRIFVSHRLTGGLGGGTSEMLALNVADGTNAWPMPVAMPAFTWGAVTHANGVVYTSIQNGRVFALEAATGKQLWTTMLPQGSAGGPSVSNGWLYVPAGYTGLGTDTPSASLNAYSLPGDSGPAPSPGGPPPTAGTSGGTPPAPAGGAAFAKVIDVFENGHGCIGGFCHGESGGLNLQAEPRAQYDSLVGADKKGAPTGDPMTTTGLCGGQRRVVPGDPMSSLLYLKLAGMHTCGDRMPTAGSGLPQLTADELTVVRNWIMSGAPFD